MATSPEPKRSVLKRCAAARRAPPHRRWLSQRRRLQQWRGVDHQPTHRLLRRQAVYQSLDFEHTWSQVARRRPPAAAPAP